MRRPVVTGIGAVSPFGYGVQALWSGLVEKRNAIRRITSLTLSGEVVQIAAETPILNEPSDSCGNRPPEDPFARTCMLAVREAIEMSGLERNVLADNDRVGSFIADRTMGQVAYLDAYAPVFHDCRGLDVANWEMEFHRGLRRHGLLKDRQNLDPDSVNHIVARAYGISGPQLSISTACASSSTSIGEAMLAIRSGDIDIVVVGGAYNFDLSAMIGFTRLGALTTSLDPETASRPFDAERNGFVMGSGCGVLVIEEDSSAKRRGAEILCEVSGYGSYGDAYRATDPDPEASGISRTIAACLTSARVAPEQIDYINAHGTSTKMNDLAETTGIKRVFGEAARNVPVSSTKSMIGHGIMAAGALEAIVCIKSILTGTIHPTRNWTHPDPALDLDYVPDGPRTVPIRHALSNSFGFGGQNVSVLFSAFRH